LSSTSPDPATRSPIFRALPLVLLVGTYAVLLRTALSPVSNADTLFHVRIGHEFLGDWSLGHPGSISSLATSTWVPTQWVPEVVLARFEDWFGLPGVAWLTGVQLIAFTVAVFALCKRQSDLLAAVVVTQLTLVACGGGLSGRPQVLSYLLAAVTLGAWLRTARDGRLPWWLIPLTWLWAMVHGMWPVGPVIGIVAIAGGALDRRLQGRRLVSAVGIVTGSVLVTTLTPVGWSIFGAVSAVGDRTRFIPEWAPPDFTEPGPLVLALMFACYLLVRLRSGDLIPWTELAFLLLAAGWAVYSGRTTALAAVVLAPFLAAAFQSVIPRTEPIPRETLTTAAIGLAALGVLTVGVALAPLTPSYDAAVDDALDDLAPNTLVLNEWADGGYLMWRHPDLQIGMHGYVDMYSTDEIETLSNLLDAGYGWETQLTETSAHYAVLPPNIVLERALENDGWRRVAEGPTRVLLSDR